MTDKQHRENLIILAIATDEAFLEASVAKCTCFSDPEGPCSFCSRWEKAERKLEKFKQLVQRGLGID
jgi:hypothetical protein